MKNAWTTAGGAFYGSPFRRLRDAAEGFGSSFAIRASYSDARSSSLLGEGVGVFRETSAAFCVFFQGI